MFSRAAAAVGVIVVAITCEHASKCVCVCVCVCVCARVRAYVCVCVCVCVCVLDISQRYSFLVALNSARLREVAVCKLKPLRKYFPVYIKLKKCKLLLFNVLTK